jgi:hypothetical protein
MEGIIWNEVMDIKAQTNEVEAALPSGNHVPTKLSPPPCENGGGQYEWRKIKKDLKSDDPVGLNFLNKKSEERLTF